MYILYQCISHVKVQSHTNAVPIFQGNALKSQKRKKRKRKQTFVKIENTIKLPKIYQFSHVNCKILAILFGYNFKKEYFMQEK